MIIELYRNYTRLVRSIWKTGVIVKIGHSFELIKTGDYVIVNGNEGYIEIVE